MDQITAPDSGFLAESGINIVNAIFAVPLGFVRLLEPARQHREWRDDGWELTTTIMMGFLLEDGSYSISYEFGRGGDCLENEFEQIDLEEMLRVSDRR